MGRTLAHVAVTGNQGYFARNHDVGRALDRVNQGLAAAIQVIKLGFGHGIIDVDRAESEFAFGRHFVQTQNARGGFFGYTDDILQTAAIPSGIDFEFGFDAFKQANLFFAFRLGQDFDIFLSFGAQMHEQRSVTAVVQNHIGAFGSGAFASRKFKNTVGVIPVIGQVLAFVGKHWCTCSDQCRSGVVLGRENIARSPADFSTQCLQGFNQHTGLNGHMQRAGNACSLEGLCFGKLFANSHQAGHFRLGNVEFFAAPSG